MEKYRSLEIFQKNPNSPVFNLHLNRPSHRNSLNRDFFTEFPRAISSLDQNPDVAVIIVAANGDHFCSGIDFSTLASISGGLLQPGVDRGRAAERLRREIMGMQDSITAVERCRKPVIAAVHGGCIGCDIIAACDIRFCTEDAFFAVKHVDVAITGDLGTLQRLPRIVGYGNAAELALTGRKFSGAEAKKLGLVSMVFPTKDAMHAGVRAVAEEIAAKSPLAVTGTKAVLLRSRDLTVDQGLDYVATWNSGVLLSDDLMEAVSSQTQKRRPSFAKL